MGFSSDSAQRGQPAHHCFRHTPRSLSLLQADARSDVGTGEIPANCQRCVADDLITHGKDVDELDQCLSAVLDRLSEVGLTVNGEKCEFRLSKFTFFGHELTSDGVNPSEEKVAAMRDD